MKRFIKGLCFNFIMGEIDYVIPNIQVTWKGKVDLKEVYSFAKKWLLERKYDLSENEYKNDETDSGNNLRIKWWAFKKVDDFSRFNIDVIFTGRGLKRVNSKNHVLLDGSITVEFESYIEKDYENIWAMKPWQKFSREVFDKFLQRGKYERYSEELKDETLTLRDEVKRLLDGMKY